MKYIKTFEEVNSTEVEKLDEGIKEWIIAGALALASAGGVKSQKLNSIKQPDKEYVSKDTTITVDFGSDFESGTYKFDKSKSEETQYKLAKIAEFAKKFKNSNIKIMIEGSESLVPNVDKETGKRLPKGGLSKMRVIEVKDIIESYMDKLLGKGVFNGSYDTLTKIGTTPYKYGESPSQEKFKREQYVKVTLSVVSEKEGSDKYTIYSETGETVFINKKAIGQIFYKSRESKDVKTTGNVDMQHENVLLRTFTPEIEYAETKKRYDGKIYLIPSDWWNGSPGKDGVKRQTTTNHLTDDDLEYIMKNYEVKN